MEIRDEWFNNGLPAEPEQADLSWTRVLEVCGSDEPALLPLLQTRVGLDHAACRPLLHGPTRGIRRPTLQRHGSTVMLSLRTLGYEAATDAVESEEEWFIARGSDVISLTRRTEGPTLVRPTDRREHRGDAPRLLAPVDALHEVLVRVVGEYDEVLAELEIDVDEVETSVFSPTRSEDAQRIYRVKREVAETRRAVVPLADLLTRDLPHDPDLGVWAERPAARDVVERLHRIAEGVEVLDELLTSILSAHVARVSSQQNEDMRRISAGAALIVVPTLLAGVWGMNFEQTIFPPWDSRYGFSFAVSVMAASVLLLWWRFKRSGWL